MRTRQGGNVLLWNTMYTFLKSFRMITTIEYKQNNILTSAASVLNERDFWAYLFAFLQTLNRNVTCNVRNDKGAICNDQE